MASINQSPENGDGNNNNTGVVVVMVPLPAQGHLNQLLHLSRIITSYNIPVHYASAAVFNRQAKLRVHGWQLEDNSNIQFHDLPMPSFDNPPPNPKAPTKYPVQLLPAILSSVHLLQPFQELLRKISSNTRRVVVVHDSLMNYVVQDVPSIPNAESYCFHSISAFSMVAFLSIVFGKPVMVDGQAIKNLPTTERCYPSEVGEFLELQQKSIKRNWGNLFNTCRVVEGEYLNILAELRLSETDNHWAIGPLNPVLTPEEKKGDYKRHECIEWLDKRAPNSVIFVSFGTTSSFTDEEIAEIAVGLERSGQNFVWVLREADRGDVFKGEVIKAQLPDGYEQRIEGRGMILRDWAPQLEILRHSSTGGFMSHCGWNSSMESISLGVPIAAWPMHSDQPFNAILLTQVLKVGVVVRDWALEQEILKSSAVENAVKRLMASAEGDEMRHRAADLSNAVKKSLIDSTTTWTQSITDLGPCRLNNTTASGEMDSFIAHISR